MLTHFSLFSGIGGIDLAAERAGFITVGQCEIAEYPYKVLCKHWPEVPKWRDVRDVTADSIRSVGIDRIDLLTGGYPCQPFSVAGKRRGTTDDRHLWPEMFRVIQEIRPTWVLGENVAGHVSLGLDDVLSDLESISYAAQTFVIPACAVGAPHRRDRVFVVAYAYGAGRKELDPSGQSKRSGHDIRGVDSGWADRTVESRVGRVLDGLSDWLDGLRWPEKLGQAIRLGTAESHRTVYERRTQATSVPSDTLSLTPIEMLRKYCCSATSLSDSTGYSRDRKKAPRLRGEIPQ